MVDLSFILPVYNAERYLNKCINSVLVAFAKASNYNIEIIIIDDGSSDNSLQLLKEFQKKYDFIHLFVQSNRGVYVARNKGLDVAKGKFIWFIDSDDTIKLNSIHTIQQKTKISKAEVFHFPYTQEIEKNKFREYHLNPNFTENEFIDGLSFLKYNDGRLYLWTNIYKRDFLNKNGLKFSGEIRSLEDSLFNIKTFYFANSVTFINEHLYEYRINSFSISRNHSKEKLDVLKESSYFVHNQLLVFLNSLEPNTRGNSIVYEKMAHSVLGFFYSLLVQNYSYAVIVKSLEDYNEMGFLPVKSKNESKKVKMFQWLLNRPTLFLLASRFFKLIG